MSPAESEGLPPRRQLRRWSHRSRERDSVPSTAPGERPLDPLPARPALGRGASYSAIFARHSSISSSSGSSTGGVVQPRCSTKNETSSGMRRCASPTVSTNSTGAPGKCDQVTPVGARQAIHPPLPCSSAAWHWHARVLADGASPPQVAVEARHRQRRPPPHPAWTARSSSLRRHGLEVLGWRMRASKMSRNDPSFPSTIRSVLG